MSIYFIDFIIYLFVFIISIIVRFSIFSLFIFNNFIIENEVNSIYLFDYFNINSQITFICILLLFSEFNEISKALANNIIENRRIKSLVMNGMFILCL